MRDFWRSSGFHLLVRDASGRLGAAWRLRLKPQNLLVNLPLARRD